MNKSLKEKVESLLINILSDGFNRSMRALEDSGAVETKKMRQEYKGNGSKYYDMVSKELDYTAKNAAPGLIKALSEDK